MEDTEAMLAQMFCQSDSTAQQMIVGAKNAVNDRMATAMDPIDLFIEAIKLDVLPPAMQIELTTVEVGALLSVAMSHSGAFTRVPERMFYTTGMGLLLGRLSEMKPARQGYTVTDWLTAALYGYTPGHTRRQVRTYGASDALRAVMAHHGLPTSTLV